jgi:lysophospholipase L1-like esterase
VLVVVAAVSLIATSCSSTPSDVAAVGDSITVQVQDQLTSGDESRWDVAATIGATAEQMRPGAAELAAGGHDQAVINLGTNDALEGVPRNTTVANLEAMLDGFSGVDCTHLVTVSTELPESGTDAPAAAAAINEWLRRTADERDGVEIIDWQAEVAAPGGDELLRPDRIHPNEQGRERLVEMMRDAVGAC